MSLSPTKINRNLFLLLGLICCIQIGTANGALAKSSKSTKKSKIVKNRFSGRVSWYGKQFQGKKTASGERFNMYGYTCAHKTLPFGTRILIENPKNGKMVVVKVTDRGPYVKGRVLDLTRAAAKKLGILLGGTAFVDCTIIRRPTKKKK